MSGKCCAVSIGSGQENKRADEGEARRPLADGREEAASMSAEPTAVDGQGEGPSNKLVESMEVEDSKPAASTESTAVDGQNGAEATPQGAEPTPVDGDRHAEPGNKPTASTAVDGQKAAEATPQGSNKQAEPTGHEEPGNKPVECTEVEGSKQKGSTAVDGNMSGVRRGAAASPSSGSRQLAKICQAKDRVEVFRIQVYSSFIITCLDVKCSPLSLMDARNPHALMFQELVELSSDDEAPQKSKCEENLRAELVELVAKLR